MTIKHIRRGGNLCLRISHGAGKTKVRSLKIPIPSYGITRTGRISRELPGYSDIKAVSVKHQDKLEEIYAGLRRDLGRSPMLDEILDSYDLWKEGQVVEHQSLYLMDYWDGYVEERRIELRDKKRSMKKLHDVENDLIVMGRRRKIRLTEISASLVYDFIQMLQEGRGYSGKVNGNNTINKKLTELRGFFRHLERRRLHEDTSYDRVKLDSYEPEEPAYTDEELEMIYNWDPKSPGFRAVHEKARDLYIFCGETAVSHGDLKYVSPKNIHEVDTDMGSFKVLRFRRNKTQGESVIPLSKRAIDILEKYDYHLPNTTNQECNRCIKDIARAVGIQGTHTFIKWVGDQRIENTVPRWQAIKFHSSRRSFITNSLMRGENISLVGKVAGQKSERTTSGYFQPGADRQTLAMVQANKDRFIY